MFTQVHVLYPMRAILAGSPVASQSLAVSTVAVSPAGYTASPAVDGVTLATFDVQGGDVRVRWDGTPATSTVGHFLPAGTAYTWDITQFNSASFIQDTASATGATIFSSAMMA